MLSKIVRPSLAISSRLGYSGAISRRCQTTAAAAASTESSAPNFPTESLATRKPFEHVPWKAAAKTQGTIRFLGGTTDGAPAFLNFKKGEEHQTNIAPSKEVVVDITDLRNYEPRTTLGVEGVEWADAPTALTEDRLLVPEKAEVESYVRGQYFDECARLVKERTGATRSVAYNYRHRRIEENTNLHDPYNFSSKPLSNFHMDNDAKTAEINLRRVLGDEEAARWLDKHWGIINVWRPVGDVVRQWPLALVDSHTVRYGNDTEPIFTKNNYKTHFTALKYMPHYKFYYVSNLTPDEALLFVDYDSQPKGNGTVVGMAHGAFEDHNGPADPPRRRSIEVRCLVLYDD